jgi:hypothetical protein
MTRWAKSQAPTLKPTQDFKCAQCELKVMLEMMLKIKWSCNLLKMFSQSQFHPLSANYMKGGMHVITFEGKCRNPSFGLATKARVCKGAGQDWAWECKRVWGNEPSHSQMNSHFGSWSPNGLSNLQRVIAGVKIYWIEEFLISLEKSWNVDVWNGLARPIWTPETQVMAKRRVGSRIGNLTFDH